MATLEVRDLHLSIGGVPILRGVSFDLDPGQTLGIVGESGCGKSMTAFSVMGMLPNKGKITQGSIKLEGRELVGLSDKQYSQVRGREVALIMQDPFTSLNPMMRVGTQIVESLKLHRGLSGQEAWREAVKLLDHVGIPAPESSARKFPHQMSGGQRQRVVIAMAFSSRPKVLIADEPTTALDVTLQAQILRLLKQLQEEHGCAVMMISHDIGAIAAVSHRVAVFYAGRIVEVGPAELVLRHGAMPYTRALLNALPRPGRTDLETISGQPPMLGNLPKGCSFGPRCPFRTEACDVEPELKLVGPDRLAACWHGEKVAALEEGALIRSATLS
jgi:oligopeptide/dipeptide ABC transporter ATP-binding protein